MGRSRRTSKWDNRQAAETTPQQPARERGWKSGKAKVDAENPVEVVLIMPGSKAQAIYDLRDANEGTLSQFPVDEHSSNGKLIRRTMVRRNQRESALERLHGAGVLGNAPDAEIRYLAGCWLREVFVAVYPGSNLLARLNSTASSGAQVSGIGSWSEAKIAEVFLLGLILTKIGEPAPAIEAVCRHDSADVRMSALRRGLDQLAYLLCHPKVMFGTKWENQAECGRKPDLRDIDAGKETLAVLREKFSARQRERTQRGREEKKEVNDAD